MHGFIKGGGVVVTIGYLYLIPFKIEARCRFFVVNLTKCNLRIGKFRESWVQCFKWTILDIFCLFFIFLIILSIDSYLFWFVSVSFLHCFHHKHGIYFFSNNNYILAKALFFINYYFIFQLKPYRTALFVASKDRQRFMLSDC